MALDITTFVAELRTAAQKEPLYGRLALMMEQVQDAVNQQGNVLGVDSTQHNNPPPAPSAITVKAGGGIAHITINDTSPRGRALNYFIEHDVDPNFGNPQVIHPGASRTHFVTLPAKDDNGDAQPWYFRAYSMELGSQRRSDHIYFGGAATPTPVDVGGTGQFTPLPSTGSGTASTTGQQGGQGFGTTQFVREGTGKPTT